MDDTDKKLIEGAARAAGWPIDFWQADENGVPVAYYVNERGGHSAFQPLHENKCCDCMGDALRLAVKLGISVWRDDDLLWVAGRPEPYEGDPLAATRRAIVRAAAALGSVEHGSGG